MLDYTSPTSSKLEVTKTGEGDYESFVSAISEGKDRASYGYVRVQYKNDDHAVREKFAFVIWIGPETKLMRKARVSARANELLSQAHAYCLHQVSVHKNDVTSVIRTYSIEVPASSVEDLKEVRSR